MSERKRIAIPVADLHDKPRNDSMRVTQGLYGEAVEILHSAGEWAHVRLVRDGYEGHVIAQALGDSQVLASRLFSVPAGHIYSAPDIKSSPVTEIYRGACVAVKATDGGFMELAEGGFVHAAQMQEAPTDMAAKASEYLFVPYLWGGKTSRGIDCSGLVQVILQACGMESPRDSGPQEKALGRPLAAFETPDRNDLVFWKGHVGMLTGPQKLIHANAFHMRVAEEDFGQARQRIGEPTSIRRLQ